MSPSPREQPATAAQGRRFDVLVVGTLNLCRSPAAERLLRARFGDAGQVRVASAGTRPALGEPVPAPMAELLAAEGVAVDGHVPRLLDPAMIEAADLVLTVTRPERADVVRAVPTAVRRSFTLRELARVASSLDPADLPDGDVRERLAAFLDAAPPRRRPTAPEPVTDDDILDPYGLDVDGYAESFDQVLAAVDGIVRVVLPEPPTTGEPAALPAARRPAVRSRPGRTRTVLLAVLASLVVLAVSATAGALVVMDRLDNRIERFPDPFADLPSRPPPVVRAAPAPADEPPLTVLVLGSADDVEGTGLADWETAAALTDVVMLARITGDRKSVQLVAMSPELSVDVPDEGRGTLRSAFATGGPALAVQTVEQLSAVRVDHVALIDSATFDRVTEALGGVDVDVPDDVVLAGRVVVPAGRQRLSGEQARLWVHGAGEDEDQEDTARLERERAWLAAILTRLGDDDVRRDPTAWLTLLGVVSDSVAVDEGLDRDRLTAILTGLRGLRPEDVDLVAAPTTVAADGVAGAGSAELVPDAAPFEAMMAALRTDTLGDHLAAADAG